MSHCEKKMNDVSLSLTSCSDGDNQSRGIKSGRAVHTTVFLYT